MRRTNDFLVGLAVLAVSATLLGATLWANEAELGGRRARVTARFRDVGGVRVGDAVMIRGVKTGRVDAIELADDGWVDVRLRLEEGVRLPARPVALLTESSLFGEWQATVLDESALPDDRDVRRQAADAAVAARARDAPRGAIPGATLPDIAQLTTVAGRIAGDVASVARRVQVAFDDSAAHEMRRSIANVAEMSAAMREMSGLLSQTVAAQARNLDATGRDVRAGAAALTASAQAFQHVASRVDSSTSGGEVRSIVEQVGRASAQLEQAASQLRDVSRKVSASHDVLDRIVQRTDTVLGKLNGGAGTFSLLLNDGSLYRNADSLLVQLRSLSADVQAHPKKYVQVRIF
jgi:phospholipid/cholesterol/gamma-HCH transport system substrate-binding protein